MQTANIFLALGGKRSETVPKYGVTVPEIAVLRFLHGEDAVFDIELAGEVQRTSRQEIERLRAAYGRWEGDRRISPAVNALFPGVGAQVPQKLADLELPDELFAVEKRKTDALDHDGDGVKGGVKNDDDGYSGMTVNELRAHADKIGADISGITRKQDIIEAIELHEANASAPVEPEAPATGSVFE